MGGVAGREVIGGVEMGEEEVRVREARWVELVCQGKSGAGAFEVVFGRKGSKWEVRKFGERAGVLEGLRAARERAALGAVLSLEEKRAFLRRVVVTAVGTVGADSDLAQSVRRRYGKDGELVEEEVKMCGKLEAVRLDNMMAGHEAPKEVNHHMLVDMQALLERLPDTTKPGLVLEMEAREVKAMEGEVVHHG